MGFHPIPPCSKNCRIGKKQMVSILCAVYFEGLRQVQRLLFGANLPGCAKPDQLLVQKGFALLLLAQKQPKRGGGSTREFGRSCQRLPHKLYCRSFSAPAAVQTPPHPRLCSFLASNLLMGSAFLPDPNAGNVQSVVSVHDAFYTRLIEHSNLIKLHAPLKAVLPGNKCSHSLCVPCLQRRFSGEIHAHACSACRTDFFIPSIIPSRGYGGLPRPIARTVKSVSPARGAESGFAREQMLSHPSPVRGYGGLPPCLPIALDLSPLTLTLFLKYPGYPYPQAWSSPR